ncbi:MAG: hypothetical protein QOJ76_2194 [Acidobacteriota bacterium]|jgi:hypothetical protein|nr:hypothetical protein [Acidobacteriota bacterium]
MGARALSITRKIGRALRGRVSLRAALLETGRRVVVVLRRRLERASPSGRAEGYAATTARLASVFARMSGAELSAHFRERATPHFFAGFDAAEGEGFDATEVARFDAVENEGGRGRLAEKSGGLIEDARAVVEHRLPLLGYGTRELGATVDWLREPVSGVRWPLEYHGDVVLARGDGSDVRVLWELNRLGHLLTLGRAFAATSDEAWAEEFFAQVDSWRAQNPVGFGPNWACAMEVALRAMNLLAAFRLLRRSRALNEERLSTLLALLDAHGRHIRRNLEFSYIANGNHYLSDVAGLVWLGVCLPELRAAEGWRAFGLRELMRELDAQVLPDGADCEASTGYHRFVTELFLYSFILCRANGIRVAERHRQRLRSMLEYVRAYLRPDGRAPLVGDTDGGQVLPLVRRGADDHAYLLAVGAALFHEPRFKILEDAPEEIFWLLGPEGVRVYAELETAGTQPATPAAISAAFERAGTCVLREGDLYLLLTASGAGLGGRGAHGHNDALSLEVSACGVNFLADPGTYVYTSDTRARQLFRSTGYHSTVEVDGTEQNTTFEDAPFFIGDEARPRLLSFASGDERDTASAEHHGYERLPAGPVTHRRAVMFDKRERYWLVEDSLTGAGSHDFRFIFHAAPGHEVRILNGPGAEIRDNSSVGIRDISAVEIHEGSAVENHERSAVEIRHGSAVEIVDGATGARLVVASLEGSDALEGVTLEARLSSREYGSKVETVAAVWTLRASAPACARWLLLPVCAGEDASARLELLTRLRIKAGECARGASLVADLSNASSIVNL